MQVMYVISGWCHTSLKILVFWLFTFHHQWTSLCYQHLTMSIMTGVSQSIGCSSSITSLRFLYFWVVILCFLHPFSSLPHLFLQFCCAHSHSLSVLYVFDFVCMCVCVPPVRAPLIFAETEAHSPYFCRDRVPDCVCVGTQALPLFFVKSVCTPPLKIVESAPGACVWGCMCVFMIFVSLFICLFVCLTGYSIRQGLRF